MAIVTGGGAGIGKAVAELLSREGASVTVADFDEAAGMEVVLGINRSGGNAIFVKTDVGIKSDVVGIVEETAAAFGTVNILINNAWAGSDLLRFEWEADAWMQRAYEMGALGPYWAMQAAFPYMKKQAWGRVVNLCSLNGVNAHMYMVAYNSAKEALRCMTRTAAREWASRGITCNVVCPAAESTAAKKMREREPQMFEKLLETSPMGRLGDCEKDIAPVILFLASEESRYVTGNTLFVDGGGHINGVKWTPELPERQP